MKANPPVDRLNRLNAVSLLKTGQPKKQDMNKETIALQARHNQVFPRMKLARVLFMKDRHGYFLTVKAHSLPW